MRGALTHSTLLPAATRTTTGGGTGAATDVSSYANNATSEFYAILDIGAITSTQGNLDVTIEQCATTNGTYSTIATFTQATNTTGGQVKHVNVTQRYVRAVGTTSGTSPSYTYGVYLVGVARYA